jgi:prolyl oligopeptidase
MNKYLSVFPSGLSPRRFVLILTLAWTATSPGQIRTATKAASADYHGTRVVDNYQWLENSNDPAVRKWTADQNKVARTYLDKLPTREHLAYDFNKLFSNVSADYSSLTIRSNLVFALKFKPPAQQPVLVTMRSPNDIRSESLVLDPAALDPQGGTSIDFFEPSRDGRYVAVSLSEKGSEAGTVYVFDTATGRKHMDAVPRVQFPTAGGSVVWNHDGSGFFYTRYPAPGERAAVDARFYQQVYFHQLGTPPDRDRYEIGREFPRIAEIDLKASLDHQHILATVSNGDGGDYAHFLRDVSGKWTQITRFEDGVKQIEFGRDPLYIEWPKDDSLYLLSRNNAPRGKILKVPLAQPDLAASKVVVAERTNKVLQGFVPSSSGLYLHVINGGPSELRFHDLYAEDDGLTNDDESEGEARRGGDRGSSQRSEGATTGEREGNQQRAERPGTDDRGARGGRGERGERERRRPRKEWRLPLTGTFSVQQMVCRRGDEVLFRTIRYTAPYAWSTYDPSKDRDRVNSTELKGTSPADFEDVEVLRETVTSKDGTKVPLNLIKRKGARLNGDIPTILTGYGGYGISMTPRFDFTRRVWLEHGGMFAVANLRGGGEFGEEWHKGGNLTRKQNVFDDFIACAEFLIRSNYTKPDRLAIEGRSNGGLLVGAALTQRPDLFRAVIGHVGVYDMLRVELDPNGEYNTTEFGTVKIPDQFRALYAYSPYHRVTEKVAYPSVLLLTGEHDGRVNPSHSKKLTARLQAATASKNPVFLRTSGSSGHGMGTALNERIAQLVDVYSFLFERLGIDYSLVARGPWAGAMTPTSTTVKARVARENLPTRLALSTSTLLTNPRLTPMVRSTTNTYNVVTFPLDGLKPDTTYHYALEVNGKLERAKRGQFRTHPSPGPASFQFAFASCARTASTSEVFDSIRENKPLFYMNVGDFHYQNLTNSDMRKFREAYDLVLTSPQQADLYRSTAFFYMWDDHDFGGNNSNRKSTSQVAVKRAYDEYVPHYKLAEPVGEAPIYQSFAVGRTKFIITDLRSDRDDPKIKDDEKKTLLGTRQKEWFKEELLSAKDKYPLIFWVSSVPFLGVRGSNYYRVPTNYWGFVHHTNFPGQVSTNRPGRRNRIPGADEDHWSAFATERREICDFVVTNNIKGLTILHGDAHMFGADDGSHSDFSTMGGFRAPVLCGGPLDQDSSIKGGPYSHGVYKVRRREGGFALMTVNDRGDRIDVRYSGRTSKNEEKIALEFSVPATSTSQTKVIR